VSANDWPLRAGEYRALVRADESVADLLHGLLADLFDHEPATSTDAGLIEVAHAGADIFEIRSDGRVWNDAVPADQLFDEIVHMLLRAALDAEPDRVHIHAGAVTGADGAVVLAGWPGSGKSSAIAALVEAGFGYMTDERLSVSSDGRQVAGFAKPISLIAGSFEAFAHLDPARTGVGLSDGATWQVPASSIGHVAPPTAHDVTAIVFVAYEHGAPLRRTSIDPVTAATRLLGDSPDAIVRGRAGAAAIVALTASAPCFEIHYGSTAHLVECLTELADDAPPTNDDLIVELTGAAPSSDPPPTPNAVDTSQRYSLRDDTSAWIVGETSLAYRSGDVVELDATHTVWLELFADAPTLDSVIADVADATGADVRDVEGLARQIVHGLWTAHVIGVSSGA
jgi:hypothetical protein